MINLEKGLLFCKRLVKRHRKALGAAIVFVLAIFVTLHAIGSVLDIASLAPVKREYCARVAETQHCLAVGANLKTMISRILCESLILSAVLKDYLLEHKLTTLALLGGVILLYLDLRPKRKRQRRPRGPRIR